jgi:hypothetical protein
MKRRPAPLTLLAIAALLAAVTTAGAFSSRTRLCIAAAKNARLKCTGTCTSDYSNTFATCFGPGADCAAMCISGQATCLSGPIAARTACQKDTVPDPTQPTVGACSVTLRNDLQDCTGPDVADPTGCASAARVKALVCTNACTVLYQPMVQDCATAFNDCTQACASCRNPSDCPFPTARRAQ